MDPALPEKPIPLKRLDPKRCQHAKPYMVDNGVLDVYRCLKHDGNCYFEPNGGPQFKKMCDKNHKKA